MRATSTTAMFAFAALSLGGCDGDDCNPDKDLDCSADGGLNAVVDAKADLQLDAAEPSCTVDQSYLFYDDGGNSPYRDVYEVGATQVELKRTVSERAGGTGSFSCSQALPCGSYVGIDHFHAALADPLVMASWGDGSMMFGADQRPVDGPALAIEREDHKKILIGAPCGGEPRCIPIPPAIEKLRKLFHDMREQLAFEPLPDGGLASRCTPIQGP